MAGAAGRVLKEGVVGVANMTGSVLPSMGGAVDIVVVRQKDGSFRSSPFYVRFGKFQGLLKGRERTVMLTVDGVQRDLVMALNSSGEAYFPDVEAKDTPSSVCDSEDRSGYSSGEESGSAGRAPQGNGGRGWGRWGWGRWGSNKKGEPKHGCGSNAQAGEIPGMMPALPPPPDLICCDAQPPSTDSPALSDPPPDKAGAVQEDAVPSTNVPAGAASQEAPAIGRTVSAPPAENVSRSLAFGASLDAGSQSAGELVEPEDRYLSCLQLEELEGQQAQEAQEGGDADPVASPTKEEEDAPDPLEPAAPPSPSRTPPASPHKPCTQRSPARRESQESSAAAVPATVPEGPSEEAAEVERVGSGVGTEGENEDERDANSDSLGTCAVAGAEGAGKEAAADRLRSLSEPVVGALRTPDAAARAAPDSLSDGVCAGVDHLGSTATATAFSPAPSAPAPPLEMSLCRHLLQPGMLAAQMDAIFARHLVDRAKFEQDPQGVLKSAQLICRVSGNLLPWEEAVPFLAAHLAFSAPLPPPPPTVETFCTPEGLVEVRHTGDALAADAAAFVPELSCASASSSRPGVEPAMVVVGQQTKSAEWYKRRMLKKVPTSAELASLGLKPGRNVIKFTFETSMWGKQEVCTCAYLWEWNAKIVVSDVDGTITKSDMLGHLLPMMGSSWAHVGIASLYRSIKDNGYEFLFLTSRAIAQADVTRDYLSNLCQDGAVLPEGPLIMSPDGITTSLFREVIRKTPHEFKIASLQTIRELFPDIWNPFYAGFGNRETDERSYKAVSVQEGKIFTINPSSQIVCSLNKSKTYTLADISLLLDHMFPPVAQKEGDVQEHEVYNSWNYWKTGMEFDDDDDSIE